MRRAAVDYRKSLYELAEVLQAAIRHWVQGFLARSLPRQPDVDADADEQLAD